MKRRSCFAKSPREDSQKTEERFTTFEDICRFFSKEDSAKLEDSQKRIYMYMKRKYETMTRLGLRATFPSIMHMMNETPKYFESDLDEDENPRNEDEGPQEATDVQEREHAKVSPKPEGPQSFSTAMDVNMERPMKAAREDNDMEPLPVTPASEPAPKELCPPEKASASGQESEMSGPRKVKSSIWAHRLRERKIRILYKESNDSEESD